MEVAEPVVSQAVPGSDNGQDNGRSQCINERIRRRSRRMGRMLSPRSGAQFACRERAINKRRRDVCGGVSPNPHRSGSNAIQQPSGQCTRQTAGSSSNVGNSRSLGLRRAAVRHHFWLVHLRRTTPSLFPPSLLSTLSPSSLPQPLALFTLFSCLWNMCTSAVHVIRAQRVTNRRRETQYLGPGLIGTCCRSVVYNVYWH